MRHRILSGIVTGLGNPDPVILDNNGNLNLEFADHAMDLYFSKEEGFDFSIRRDAIMIGIEPAYQYERLKLIVIHKDKNKSYIQNGKSWGPYGSQIVKTTKTYGEYKNKSKFVKFVDKWHEVLFGSVK